MRANRGVLSVLAESSPSSKNGLYSIAGITAEKTSPLAKRPSFTAAFSEANAVETAMKDRLIGMREAMAITGMGRSTIYKKMKIGDFPPGILKFGRRKWWESEILALYPRQPDTPEPPSAPKPNAIRPRPKARAADSAEASIETLPRRKRRKLARHRKPVKGKPSERIVKTPPGSS
jgi:predicted DNA-binding transcriptional regulator AlpA